jgi:hypothetical protein
MTVNVYFPSGARATVYGATRFEFQEREVTLQNGTRGVARNTVEMFTVFKGDAVVAAFRADQIAGYHLED